jgi:Rho termination factor, N-terminal domain
MFDAVAGGEMQHPSKWPKEVTMPNSSIKDEKLYQDLRKQGDSKEKAARISNAAAARGRSSVAKSGGKSGSYQDWTVTELKKRAKELGLSGYSSLTKDKLIKKIRNH